MVWPAKKTTEKKTRKIQPKSKQIQQESKGSKYRLVLSRLSFCCHFPIIILFFFGLLKNTVTELEVFRTRGCGCQPRCRGQGKQPSLTTGERGPPPKRPLPTTAAVVAARGGRDASATTAVCPLAAWTTHVLPWRSGRPLSRCRRRHGQG